MNARVGQHALGRQAPLSEPFYGLRHRGYKSLGRRRWRKTMTQDIRWQQRFSNYRKALAQLETFLQPPALNEREQQGLIDDGEAWMLMIQDRNLTSHTYNRSTADAIAANIVESYLPCFQQLGTRLEQRQLEEG